MEAQEMVADLLLEDLAVLAEAVLVLEVLQLVVVQEHQGKVIMVVVVLLEEHQLVAVAEAVLVLQDLVQFQQILEQLEAMEQQLL